MKRMTPAPPTRDLRHDALEAFVGEWTAERESFGGPNQDPERPRANAQRWTSKHSARWHTGRFFLIQDERAHTPDPFDTLGVIGWDEEKSSYFLQSFENHGYERRYGLAVDGRVWTLTGKTERARIEFSEDGSRQTIRWEWRPKDAWLPLCGRVAIRQAARR